MNNKRCRVNTRGSLARQFNVSKIWYALPLNRLMYLLATRSMSYYTAAVLLFGSIIASWVFLIAVVGRISSHLLNGLPTVLLRGFARVCGAGYFKVWNGQSQRIKSILGLARLALWPTTEREMVSLLCVISSISRDMVDLAPAESIAVAIPIYWGACLQWQILHFLKLQHK